MFEDSRDPHYESLPLPIQLDVILDADPSGSITNAEYEVNFCCTSLAAHSIGRTLFPLPFSQKYSMMVTRYNLHFLHVM